MARTNTTQHLEQRIRELLLSGVFEIMDVWNQLNAESYKTPNNHISIWRAIKRVEQQLIEEGYSFGWYKPIKH